MTSPKWFVGLVILWISAITAVSGWGYQRQEETNADLAAQNATLEDEIAARQIAQCVTADETRGLIRDLSKDGDLEVGESLIEVAGAETDPQAEQLREVLDRRLTAIVNQLPGRRWDPESQRCVDVELDQ